MNLLPFCSLQSGGNFAVSVELALHIHLPLLSPCWRSWFGSVINCFSYLSTEKLQVQIPSTCANTNGRETEIGKRTLRLEFKRSHCFHLCICFIGSPALNPNCSFTLGTHVAGMPANVVPSHGSALGLLSKVWDKMSLLQSCGGSFFPTWHGVESILLVFAMKNKANHRSLQETCRAILQG